MRTLLSSHDLRALLLLILQPRAAIASYALFIVASHMEALAATVKPLTEALAQNAGSLTTITQKLEEAAEALSFTAQYLTINKRLLALTTEELALKTQTEWRKIDIEMATKAMRESESNQKRIGNLLQFCGDADVPDQLRKSLSAFSDALCSDIATSMGPVSASIDDWERPNKETVATIKGLESKLES
ncbi:hypothetical protein D6D01_04307 [Aureobasidium pullulans]|uniref:Uncharacterized protein n=1 Tax=Aureobasidium pullulans TaxID=5580 RepID=A0A4S9LDF6_AURPU|nr:hypothetical protein D6D01_04307 [Aureobasidium pullulans]